MHSLGCDNRHTAPARTDPYHHTVPYQSGCSQVAGCRLNSSSTQRRRSLTVSGVGRKNISAVDWQGVVTPGYSWHGLK